MSKKNFRILNHHYRNHSLIYQWIISYAIVLIMPLFVLSFYCIRTYQTVRDFSVSNQRLMLENVKEQLDYIFYDSINITNNLLGNPYVNSLSYGKTYQTGNPSLDRHYLTSELSLLRTSNQLVRDIIIYFPSTDYIVTCDSTYPASLLSHMSKRTINYEELRSLCSSLQVNNSLCIQSGHNSALFFVSPLLLNVNQAPLSIALIQLDREKLQERLQNSIYSNNTSFALITPQTILLSVNTDALLDELPVSQIYKYYEQHPSTISNGLEYHFSNQPYIINFCPSLLENTALISITGKDFYYAAPYRILAVLILSLIFCLSAGIGIVFYFSSKNYRPIARIMHYVDNADTKHAKNNEYQLIEKYIRENQNELEHQRNILINNYLSKILKGDLPFAQISVQSSLRFSSDFSCVVIIQIQKNSVTEDFISSQGQLLHFILQNILSEMLMPTFPEHYYCTLSHHDLSLLINLPTTTEEGTDYVSYILISLEKLYAFFSSNYNIPLHIGISNFNKNEYIPDSWTQANSALEYLNLFGGQENIKRFDEIPSTPVITNLSLNTGNYVQELLLSGTSEQVNKYFITINSEIKNCNLSTTDIKSCFYFFYLTTVQVIRFCQLHYHFTPASLSFITSSSYFLQPLNTALDRISTSYLNFIEELTAFRSNYEQERWGMDICKYIENNYFDTELNLNSVSSYFSLSPSYLSKKFKDKYGKSVNDYIYEVRIGHAKKLLSDAHLKVSEVAQMTGFLDSSAFIRVFKKYVGTTPSRYSSSETSPEFTPSPPQP